jgi:hemerythrin-like domain-containing protein
MTIDLFTLPHKTLRTYLGQTATDLGALDIGDVGGLERMQRDLHDLIDELESHGAHEDAVILPLLERRLPDMDNRMRAEHVEVGSALVDLRLGISGLIGEPRAGDPLALYRQLRRFEALNLRHLDFEETIVMPALWRATPASDLVDLMDAFRSAHPEAGDLYRRAPRALTAGERLLVMGQEPS